ncbi:MAG: dephospho-CoA kinase [Planctomycetes bacterium RBG_13_46_10]|nr:MAG: dephospho-CoA kinase [Planctomycetes bacterium RBG_13_46_10]
MIGILGGIASGKSTVAAEFAKLGCKVIDADKIVHDLLQKNVIKKKIIGLFGPGILNKAGNINHQKLAEVVFADSNKLSLLNNILHPVVLERTETLIKQYQRQGRIKAIVLDMPLLAEIGWTNRCDRLIFVDCERKRRIERAQKMKGLKKNQIKIRENFQISLDNKASIADNTIDNNSDFQALVRQVFDIFSYIINK